jgi:hypothetical protein
MKKLKVMAAVAAATLMMSAAIGQDAAADLAAEISIPGESLDSGLGQLSSTYTAAEYNTPGWVRGESTDSGLGELDKGYTGAEFVTASASLVVGEIDIYEAAGNFRCGTCS